MAVIVPPMVSSGFPADSQPYTTAFELTPSIRQASCFAPFPFVICAASNLFPSLIRVITSSRFFSSREKPEMHVEYVFYPQDTVRKSIQIP